MTGIAKNRPILSNGEMVPPILSGEKTQTRRVINPQPELTLGFPGSFWWKGPEDITLHQPWTIEEMLDECPYGAPGDRLWIREAWAAPHKYDGCPPRHIPPTVSIIYRATWAGPCGLIWRPSIFMPRWACRVILEVISVRVEQVQQISEADALAEGIGFGFRMNAGWPDYQHIAPNGHCTLTQDTPEMSFASLWDFINKKRGFGWDENPWVWVVEFKLIQEGEGK